jgi:hypothetical protein
MLLASEARAAHLAAELSARTAEIEHLKLYWQSSNVSRQLQAKPLLHDLERWLHATLATYHANPIRRRRSCTPSRCGQR